MQKGDNMSLTKKDLENVYHISREIQDIERQLSILSTKQDNEVADVVLDYRTGQGVPVKITGYDNKTYRKMCILSAKLHSKRDLLLKQKIRIENELDMVEAADIRRIIRLRYFDLLSWEAIAIAIDGTKSGDAMRKRLDKYLE